MPKFTSTHCSYLVPNRLNLQSANYTHINLDRMGPKNAKFLLYLKQVFQPLVTLGHHLQGEKGASSGNSYD